MTKKNALAQKNTTKSGVLATQPNQLKSKISKNQIIKPPHITSPMTEQLVVPPPHVWNRIEKVLNEQDRLKAGSASAKTVLLYQFSKTKKQTHPLFAAMGITLMLCFVIIVF